MRERPPDVRSEVSEDLCRGSRLVTPNREGYVGNSRRRSATSTASLAIRSTSICSMISSAARSERCRTCVGSGKSIRRSYRTSGRPTTSAGCRPACSWSPSSPTAPSGRRSSPGSRSGPRTGCAASAPEHAEGTGATAGAAEGAHGSLPRRHRQGLRPPPPKPGTPALDPVAQVSIQQSGQQAELITKRRHQFGPEIG